MSAEMSRQIGSAGVYLSARSVLSAVGVSLRLDVLDGDSDGTISAVAIAFSRFAGVPFPSISESQYLIGPIHLSVHCYRRRRRLPLR